MNSDFNVSFDELLVLKNDTDLLPISFNSKTISLDSDTTATVTIWSTDELRELGLINSSSTQVDFSAFEALRVVIQKADNAHTTNQVVFAEAFIPPFTRNASSNEYFGIRGIHSTSTTTVSASFKSTPLDEGSAGFLHFEDGVGVILTTSASTKATGNYYTSVFHKTKT